MNPTTPATFVEKDLTYYLRMIRNDFSELEDIQYSRERTHGSEKNIVLVFSGPYVGVPGELGSELLPKFVQSLVRAKNRPRTMIFWCEAVQLCQADSPVLEELVLLKNMGIEILVCETSAAATDKPLKVGCLCSMDKICAHMINAWKVVKV